MLFADLTTRSSDLERLDTGDHTAEEYDRWHREMWFVNHALGDVRCLRIAVRDELRRSPDGRLSILDIGAGAGHLLAAAKHRAGNGPLLVGAEMNSSAVGRIREQAGLTAILADGLALPFRDRSFDMVVSSLTLHHFQKNSAVRLLREMDRVARRRVVVIDLHRHAMAYLLYGLLSRVAFQEFTRVDGLLSIRRGFRPRELADVAREAGLAGATVKRRTAFRLVLEMKKDA